MGMREQGCGRRRLNLRQRLGRRAMPRSQRHEAFAIAVQRQNGDDDRAIRSGIEFHAMFPLSLNSPESEIHRPMIKTALVLSGGGMFAADQAGAWQTLSRGISPAIVAAAAGGRFNGGCIAAGARADEMEC